MKQAAYCSFAGKVSHIILSVLSNFKEEFEIHIKEKRCPRVELIRCFKKQPNCIFREIYTSLSPQ